MYSRIIFVTITALSHPHTHKHTHTHIHTHTCTHTTCAHTYICTHTHTHMHTHTHTHTHIRTHACIHTATGLQSGVSLVRQAVTMHQGSAVLPSLACISSPTLGVACCWGMLREPPTSLWFRWACIQSHAHVYLWQSHIVIILTCMVQWSKWVNSANWNPQCRLNEFVINGEITEMCY